MEAQIARYIMRHFVGGSSIAIPLSIEAWDVEAAQRPDDPHVRFGYHRPKSDQQIRFCPALIAMQTGHLPLKPLVRYLNAILFQLDGYIVHKDVPDDESAEIMDRLMADVWLDGLTLLNEVQMRALDLTVR